MPKLFKRFKYRKFRFKNCLLNRHRVNFNKFVGWYCADSNCVHPTFDVSEKEAFELRQGFQVRLKQPGNYIEKMQ